MYTNVPDEPIIFKPIRVSKEAILRVEQAVDYVVTKANQDIKLLIGKPENAKLLHISTTGKLTELNCSEYRFNPQTGYLITLYGVTTHSNTKTIRYYSPGFVVDKNGIIYVRDGSKYKPLYKASSNQFEDVCEGGASKTLGLRYTWNTNNEIVCIFDLETNKQYYVGVNKSDFVICRKYFYPYGYNPFTDMNLICPDVVKRLSQQILLGYDNCSLDFTNLLRCNLTCSDKTRGCSCNYKADFRSAVHKVLYSQFIQVGNTSGYSCDKYVTEITNSDALDPIGTDKITILDGGITVETPGVLIRKFQPYALVTTDPARYEDTFTQVGRKDPVAEDILIFGPVPYKDFALPGDTITYQDENSTTTFNVVKDEISDESDVVKFDVVTQDEYKKRVGVEVSLKKRCHDPYTGVNLASIGNYAGLVKVTPTQVQELTATKTLNTYMVDLPKDRFVTVVNGKVLLLYDDQNYLWTDFDTTFKLVPVSKTSTNGFVFKTLFRPENVNHIIDFASETIYTIPNESSGCQYKIKSPTTIVVSGSNGEGFFVFEPGKGYRLVASPIKTFNSDSIELHYSMNVGNTSSLVLITIAPTAKTFTVVFDGSNIAINVTIPNAIRGLQDIIITSDLLIVSGHIFKLDPLNKLVTYVGSFRYDQVFTTPHLYTSNFFYIAQSTGSSNEVSYISLKPNVKFTEAKDLELKQMLVSKSDIQIQESNLSGNQPTKPTCEQAFTTSKFKDLSKEDAFAWLKTKLNLIKANELPGIVRLLSSYVHKVKLDKNVPPALNGKQFTIQRQWLKLPITIEKVTSDIVTWSSTIQNPLKIPVHVHFKLVNECGFSGYINSVTIEYE